MTTETKVPDRESFYDEHKDSILQAEPVTSEEERVRVKKEQWDPKWKERLRKRLNELREDQKQGKDLDKSIWLDDQVRYLLAKERGLPNPISSIREHEERLKRFHDFEVGTVEEIKRVGKAMRQPPEPPEEPPEPLESEPEPRKSFLRRIIEREKRELKDAINFWKETPRDVARDIRRVSGFLKSNAGFLRGVAASAFKGVGRMATGIGEKLEPKPTSQGSSGTPAPGPGLDSLR